VERRCSIRYRYACKGCGKYYDDLTGTVFEGHHQPLKVWILCLYLMGLNLSNRQIAHELDLSESDTYHMTTHLREGVAKKLEDVKRKTIEPLITQAVKAGSVVNTDEYNIYNWMSSTYAHKSVNHSKGEYARDEDKDGKCEVHVNTVEGFWSLLRSWLRPHRGILQEKLPLYLGFFEFVHNVRKRGKALLHSLIHVLVQPPLKINLKPD